MFLFVLGTRSTRISKPWVPPPGGAFHLLMVVLHGKRRMQGELERVYMNRVGEVQKGFPGAPCLDSILKKVEKLVWRQEGLRYSRSRPRHQGACSFRGCRCRMLWEGGKSSHGRPRALHTMLRQRDLS